MKEALLRANEIEHEGDLDHATGAFRKAGAAWVKVERTDFEGSESAVLRIGFEGDLAKLKAKVEEEDVIL